MSLSLCTMLDSHWLMRLRVASQVLYFSDQWRPLPNAKNGFLSITDHEMKAFELIFFPIIRMMLSKDSRYLLLLLLLVILLLDVFIPVGAWRRRRRRRAPPPCPYTCSASNPAINSNPYGLAKGGWVSFIDLLCITVFLGCLLCDARPMLSCYYVSHVSASRVTQTFAVVHKCL